MRNGGGGGGVSGTVQDGGCCRGNRRGLLVTDAPQKPADIEIDMIDDPRLHREPVSESRRCAGGLILRAELGGSVHRAGASGDHV